MTGHSSHTERDPIKLITAWLKSHRRALTVGAVTIALLLGGVWFFVTAAQRREAFAQRALEGARGALQSGNLALAASDLSRLIADYGNTRAGDEAVILLARTRLELGDPGQAVVELRQALEQGVSDQFLAPAYALLGAALENLGSAAEAGEAYEKASEATWYDLVAAEYLTDAGRAYWAAGDTARAIDAYQRILDQYGESPSVMEAKVRLAELGIY